MAEWWRAVGEVTEGIDGSSMELTVLTEVAGYW
jgi:hypothetical protein